MRVRRLTMSLSDKYHVHCNCCHSDGDFIQLKDVKEFIKDLKDYVNDCNHASPEQQCEEIDKLAGEKLI